MSQLTEMSVALTASRPTTAGVSWRRISGQRRRAETSRTRNAADQEIRCARISGAGTPASDRKYSGKRPHTTNAPAACATPPPADPVPSRPDTLPSPAGPGRSPRSAAPGAGAPPRPAPAVAAAVGTGVGAGRRRRRRRRCARRGVLHGGRRAAGRPGVRERRPDDAHHLGRRCAAPGVRAAAPLLPCPALLLRAALLLRPTGALLAAVTLLASLVLGAPVRLGARVLLTPRTTPLLRSALARVVAAARLRAWPAALRLGVGALPGRVPAARPLRSRRLAPGRHEVGGQLAADVRAPDLPRVARRRTERGVVRGEEAAQVLEVALEERLGLAVVRGPDDLRKVDHDRAVRADEHVVRREVAVDEVAAEHPHGLRAEVGVHRRRVLAGDAGVHEPGRRVAVGVEDELHEEDALVEHHRTRDAHPRGVQRVERVGLLRLPLLLRGGLAEPAAPGHRALRPRVADLAPLAVDRVVPERPRQARLVHLRSDRLAAVANDPEIGLLAALETRDDLVDDAVDEERCKRVVHAGDAGRSARLLLRLAARRSAGAAARGATRAGTPGAAAATGPPAAARVLAILAERVHREAAGRRGSLAGSASAAPAASARAAAPAPPAAPAAVVA